MENKIIEYENRIIGLGEDVANYMQNELKRIINKNYEDTSKSAYENLQLFLKDLRIKLLESEECD